MATYDAKPEREAMIPRMKRDKVSKVVEATWTGFRYSLTVWMWVDANGKAWMYRKLRNGKIGSSWTGTDVGTSLVPVENGAIIEI